MSETGHQSAPMFRTLSAERLRGIGVELFHACGASSDEGSAVAEELVETSLMGLDSHGVLRYAQYVDDVLSGMVKPGAPICIVEETETTAVVDCGMTFGPYSARRVTDIAIDKAASHNIACAVSRNCHHIGRLGAYAQRVAERGLIGLATVNSAKCGHFVVPWGGREGRLATNPIAFAAPTGGERPVVLDMSTAAVSEGKIRSLMQKGRDVPPGCIQDVQGRPTTDPKAFYGPPRGTILPFGGELGYKGFGLSLMVEILGGILAGCQSSQDEPYINGLCVIAVNPEAFCGAERFRFLMDDLCRYIAETPPAPQRDGVALPGQRDAATRRRRLRDGIPVPDATWAGIVAAGRKVGIEIQDDLAE